MGLDNQPGDSYQSVMRFPTVFLALCGLALNLHGQETPNPNDGAPATEETKIIGTLNDGTPSPPPPPPELPVLKARSTVARAVDVIEAAPMPGLPPVTGTVTHTLRLVEDPKLPAPPAPLPALPPDDPAVLARIAQFQQSHPATALVFVLATVYDHSRTFLRCYPSGAARKQISGWSNLDFNHFTGFATYQAKGVDGQVRRYGLLMGIGNEDTKKRAQFMSEHGAEYNPPEIPQLPDLAVGGPAFVITGGDASDSDLVELVRGMHELYRLEGARMEQAYHARDQAYEERKAYLLAHPPKPKDLIINYWRGSRSETKPQEVKP